MKINHREEAARLDALWNEVYYAMSENVPFEEGCPEEYLEHFDSYEEVLECIEWEISAELDMAAERGEW